MRGKRDNVNKCLVGGVASLATAIACGLFFSRREGTPVASAQPLPALSSPRIAGPPPAPEAAPGVSLERNQPARGSAKAMNLAAQDEDAFNDERGIFELGYRWVAEDPEAALAFVSNSSSENTVLLVALINEWTRRDPAAAAAWATRLPEGTNRARALPSLVAAWAENAPVEAARFADSLPPGNVRKEAIIAAVSGWAQRDAPAVMAWARESLPGAQQEQVYTQAMFTWSQHDPIAAAEWLRSMPDGRSWDAATSAVSGALAERYPAHAFSLAAAISDQNLRNQRLENVARRWLEADRAAAEHALVHSDLPVEFVNRLLR